MRIGMLAVLVALVISLPAPVDAASVSPGKTVAVTSGPGEGTILGPVFAFNVSLERAKRRTIILIDGTISFVGGSGGERSINMSAKVQNSLGGMVSAEGGPIQVRCQLNADCTLSGHWWVDVDALEAATPGQWANEPIEIDLIGNTAAGPAPTAAWYTLRAQAVKK